LRRLLAALEVASAGDWPRTRPVSFATMFALAGHHWQIDSDALRLAFAWSWLENQVAAATKLVPLGQTEAQRILLALTPHLEAACQTAARIDDADIGTSLPGLAILSARHETQNVRLFSS
ncbi:MAG: urease accessory protein UreF, partial [Gammaproteobacteria bacterium]|nr:urease accessory protein UreF [Gammaproteobacteria bacterium]